MSPPKQEPGNEVNSYEPCARHAAHWIALRLCYWSRGRLVVPAASKVGESVLLWRRCSVWFEWIFRRASLSGGQRPASAANRAAASAHSFHPIHGQSGCSGRIFPSDRFASKLCPLHLLAWLCERVFRAEECRCAGRVF